MNPGGPLGVPGPDHFRFIARVAISPQFGRVVGRVKSALTGSTPSLPGEPLGTPGGWFESGGPLHLGREEETNATTKGGGEGGGRGGEGGRGAQRRGGGGPGGGEAGGEGGRGAKCVAAL